MIMSVNELHALTIAKNRWQRCLPIKGDVGLKSDMIILRICGDGSGMYVMIVYMEVFFTYETVKICRGQ
jgi:hypothetical protein